MIDPDIPAPVANAAVKKCGKVSIRRLQAGMSGGTVAHCQAEDGRQYALKRWPSSIPRSRIEVIHRVVIHAWQQGCQAVARPLKLQSGSDTSKMGSADTILTIDGQNWELSPWRPGVAAKVDASLETIRQGGELIGQFHEATASLQSLHQPAPIIKERLAVLARRHHQLPLSPQLLDRQDLDTDLSASLRDAANLIHWKWNEAQQQIHRSLIQQQDDGFATQYVLRDVHSQHILFTEGRATGLIDFDAVRLDTPAADLARWAGSFLSAEHQREEIWEAALEGYRTTCRLDRFGNERLLIQTAKNLCFAGTWLSLANWLAWLLIEQRDFEVPARDLAERIYQLIRIATADE